jgi:glycosyltransferase involved in cell wall biosynthesis
VRLGIDAREIEDGVLTGIGRPLANFLRYFAKQNNSDECVLFSTKPIPIAFNARIKNTVIPKSQTQYWDQVLLPRAIKKQNIDLFYSPYYKLPLLASCPCVCAVLDLMYLIVPQYQQKLNLLSKGYYFVMGKAFLNKARRILTCSEYSKQDIKRIYGVSNDKVEVIPLSVANLYRPEQDPHKIAMMRDKWKIEGPYLLYMGNFKPHKNVKNVILAFERLVQKFPDLKLVLAGPKTYQYPDLVLLTQELSLTHKIIFTGTICEKDEPHLLYSGAQAFVMPSVYEGFGLPPAEAMACGVPVVASKTTSIPEVIKDAGLLVDPNDVDEISTAVQKILSDEKLRQELITKGFHYVKEYNEERVAKLNYDFFQSVLGHD